MTVFFRGTLAELSDSSILLPEDAFRYVSHYLIADDVSSLILIAADELDEPDISDIGDSVTCLVSTSTCAVWQVRYKDVVDKEVDIYVKFLTIRCL